MNSESQPQIKIESLVDEHGDMLFRYALARVGKHDVAEDLVQETFIAAHISSKDFEGRSTVRSWLVGILRHKIVDHHRTIAKHQSMGEDESWMNDYFDKRGHWKNTPANWKSDPATLMENGEFWDVLKHCLDNLAEPAAQAFVLRVMEELSTEDICSNLDISDSNLWVRLHRARVQLRRCLEVNWFCENSGGVVR